ncbi:MAG: MarR family transcriptional regulator [Ktedonobacteraceae bacterium]|nr:MarR family transcriptional regulator [Ktedonobacteraceae bacterium]MBA3825787.1 MarR family transcriptional regulator [Ktedonobacterales bacterium]
MPDPSASYLLGRLVFALDRAADHLLQDALGLSYKRFLFLTVLEHTGTVTQHELAVALGYSDPSVSTMLVELGKEGLLHIAPSPEHGRKHFVMITERGQTLVAQGREILDQQFDALATSAGVDTQQLSEAAERLFLALKHKTTDKECPP